MRSCLFCYYMFVGSVLIENCFVDNTGNDGYFFRHLKHRVFCAVRNDAHFTTDFIETVFNVVEIDNSHNYKSGHYRT